MHSHHPSMAGGDVRSRRILPWLLVGSLVNGGAARLLAQVEESWAARYDGPGCADDHAGDLALDGSGNVYVAGTSRGRHGAEFTVMKYDPEGIRLWSSSCEIGDEFGPPAIAVDNAGNAYVSGIAESRDTGESSLLVYKLDSNGDRQWLERPGRDGFTFFYPDYQRPALEIDSSGDIYVGAVVNQGGWWGGGDLVIFKYEIDGRELWRDKWEAGFPDPGFGFGFPWGTVLQFVSMALGQDGRIYVAAGEMLLACDASGNLEWDLFASLKWSVFGSIAVDSSGVYAAESNGSSDALNKYDHDGNLIWRVDGMEHPDADAHATCLAVDRADGCVYVRWWGHTAKYDPDGEELWAAMGDGLGRPLAISLDAQGDVYVTACEGTVKYDKAGNELWVRRARTIGATSPSMEIQWAAQAVDAHGNVHLTGSDFCFWPSCGSSSNWHTVKYDASGSVLWIARHDGPDGWSRDEPTAIASDPEGNVLVAGVSCGAGSTILKYGPTGIQLWAVKVLAVYSWAALAVDPAGNAYVTGTSSFDEDDYMATAKFAPDGTLLWMARHDGEGYDQASALVLGPEGDVYVAGGDHWWRSYATVVKYDRGGHELWRTRSDDAYAAKLAVDGEGNAYVVGEGNHPLIKYASDGREVWRAAHAGTGGGLALDPAGNVLVTGSSGEEGLYETIKYDPAGNVLWTTPFPAEGYRPSAIAVDSGGSVHVMGASREWGLAYITVKYDPDGKAMWAVTGTGGEARTLALDDQANVYVTGSAGTVKYDPLGNLVWSASFEEAQTLALDEAGNVYVAGSMYVWPNRDILTVKYAQAPESDIPRFRRGDSDADGDGDLSDAVMVLGFLFQGGAAPACLDAADADDSGSVSITDPIFLLQHLFLGGPPPADPGLGSCGPDRTLDRLEACMYPPAACEP